MARRATWPIRIAPTTRSTACCQALMALTAAPVDAGTDWFEPSTLQVTSVDVGNAATNVIPASARAALNIRFNDKHSGASLIAWVRATLSRYAERFEVEASISGESFVTKPGPLVDILRGRSRGATGDRAETGYRRRHIGCAVHRQLLSGGGIRSGGRNDASDRRKRAGGRTARPGADLSRRNLGVPG